MGIASSLFYTTDKDKQTLHKRIIPSSEHQQSQQERWDDLVKFLQVDLEEKSGYIISSWIQGSYKFMTQVRPARKGDEFDIDLGIYFNWEGKPEDGNFDAIELKSLTQKSLELYMKEAGDEVIEVINPPKNRCSRIRFTGDFHIDVPSYHSDATRDTRMLATEENIWEDSDPKALYKWFRDSIPPEDGGQLRRLIRYIKIWAALKFKEGSTRPPTILLTVLAVEAYNSLKSEEKIGDDLSFMFLVNKILDRLTKNKIIKNPVNESESINRLDNNSFMTFINELNELSRISTRALGANNEFEAATIWQEAFGHFFPFPVEDQNQNKTLALIPIKFLPVVSVEAIAKANINHKYSGINKIGPIPKECNLTFIVTNSDALPTGSKIEWVARNEGQDAEDQNDLGHFAGTGRKVTDRTAYKGNHFMDVVVKSPYGELWGFCRIPVIVSGITMPARNPKRKPGQTRFFSKRR